MPTHSPTSPKAPPLAPPAASGLILAIDQGTTSTRAALIDHQSRVLASHSVEYPNYFPSPGLVEHDADEIWQSVATAVGAVLANVHPSRIAGIGITNQRETSLFWDAVTGRPAHRALVWQDRRTAPRCEELKRDGWEDTIRDRTGLVIDPYFSGTKAEWMLKNVPGLRDGALNGELLYGTIDSYIAWKLTGVHVTDPSNASRTLLYDIHKNKWDGELLELFGVPPQCLPRTVDNAGVFGHTKGVGFLPDGIPVAGMAGDQQAALFGQACFGPGEAKCTYGTGAFLLMNTGGQAVASAHGMLTTIGWRLAGETTYALEGSAFVAGAAVQWLRDGLGIIRHSSEVEALARTVEDNGGVTFVPALAGLGAPHWRADARGMLGGLTRGSTRGHIARAVLEGMALQIADILGAMEADSLRNARPEAASAPAARLTELKVDGGAAANELLMQFQADVLGVRCVRPTNLETTAMGAAYLAGLGVGFWSSVDDVRAAWAQDRAFEPTMAAAERDHRRAAWASAVSRA